MLTDWVNAGGNLIALRPGQAARRPARPDRPRDDAHQRLPEGRHRAGTPGAGIVGDTIQFHGTADRYPLNGATAVATLYSNATTATASPAVTLRSVGANGGQAAAFTYDLARSVVYTRQGNPAWAGQERDGVRPIRPDDLFFGAKAGDMQPDWVDLNKVAIPQADEQQRLLANLITLMARGPQAAAAVLVPAARAEGRRRDDRRRPRQRRHGRPLRQVPRRQPARLLRGRLGVRALDLVHLSRRPAHRTLRPRPTPRRASRSRCTRRRSGSTRSAARTGRAAGAAGACFDTSCRVWRAKYPSVPAPTTRRMHCVSWADWVSQPKVERAHGIRLDTNYYYYPGSWMATSPAS